MRYRYVRRLILMGSISREASCEDSPDFAAWRQFLGRDKLPSEEGVCARTELSHRTEVRKAAVPMRIGGIFA